MTGAKHTPHTPGLWRNLGLSRLERVKAHRDEFGSSLAEAVGAVDEDYGRQVSAGRARLADAAPDLLEALSAMVADAERIGIDDGLADQADREIVDRARAAIAKASGAAQ